MVTCTRYGTRGPKKLYLVTENTHTFHRNYKLLAILRRIAKDEINVPLTLSGFRDNFKKSEL